MCIGSINNSLGATSIICNPDQLRLVYNALYTHCDLLDPAAYVVDCPLLAYTLGDKRATDKWGLHPILQSRLREGVPMCTPFALIVTGRKTGGDRPDDVPAGCDDFKNFHREQLHNNPCPAFCERSKYKFSMNLSRYWQENPEAPMCKEYPFAFAYANFFWWHLQPGDLVVIMSGCPMLALVAKYCGLKVLIVDRGSEDDVELIDYSLRNLHFMNAPEQTRYLIAHTHHTQPSSRFSERTHARSCPGSTKQRTGFYFLDTFVFGVLKWVCAHVHLCV